MRIKARGETVSTSFRVVEVFLRVGQIPPDRQGHRELPDPIPLRRSDVENQERAIDSKTMPVQTPGGRAIGIRGGAVSHISRTSSGVRP